MKKLIKETGIRDISALRKRYPKAEIYFHQDLDGVTTAIAMKKYLEDNGIKVVGSHIIQYGDKEFAVKKNDAQGDVMPVLVDFAHGKPMFKIHTDHHDKQVGAEKGASTSFRQARSNVETLSQIVSPKDLFPSSDVLLINTVDSADFARQDITPEDVVNYLFRFDKDKSLQKNKMLLGFVVNKLLLAFKNKPGFLEKLVMDSEPSLMSILTNIKNWMKNANTATPQQLQKNAEDYKEQMKTYSGVDYKDGIIFQYGGGNMMKPGSYDRYTPFRTHPDADFMIMAWPLGLLQVSCNPFKKERELGGVNLGEIAQEVLGKWEGQLKDRNIPLSTIKWISETSVGPESVGFTFKDFDALYGERFMFMDGGEEALDSIKEMMDKPFTDLSEEERSKLDKIGVNAWDLIQSMSGGHKCITNISGLNYLGRSKRPPTGGYKYDPEREDSPYIKFLKMLAQEFRSKLQEKISQSKGETEITEQQFKGKPITTTTPKLTSSQTKQSSLQPTTNIGSKTLQPTTNTRSKTLQPTKNTQSTRKDKKILTPSDSGYFMFFAFPKYRPSVEDSVLTRILQKVGRDAEWIEDMLGINEQKGKQIKIYATGHGGCMIISKDGNVNLFEFGPYDDKGVGKILQTSMGRIAKFDAKKSLINPEEVAKLCKTKTYRDGPNLNMFVSLLSLPDEKMAMSEAVKPRKYNFLDIVGGGDSNCATYAVDVANAGGIEDVKVGKTFDLGFGYGVPEKPTTVLKKFNKSKSFIKSFQV
jgi:hypothetical protein